MKRIINQKEKFVSGEGDAWFTRNTSRLMNIEYADKAAELNYLCHVLMPFRDNINRILEIGCSNGLNLEVMCNRFEAVGYGIEPSVLAVNSGNERHKTADIHLQIGTCDSLPFSSSSFDLVCFGFCLYLVDRDILMQSLAEADRVLKSGGFLVITDFDPGMRYKRKYSHTEGVFSYKQDYSAFFTQSGLYYLVGKKSFSHKHSHFDHMSDERVSSSILYKEQDPYLTQNY